MLASGLQLQPFDDELGSITQLIQWHRFGPLFSQEQTRHAVPDVVTTPDLVTVESYPVDTGYGGTLYNSDTHQWQTSSTRQNKAPLMPVTI